jgi:leishmanolysin
LEAAKAHYGCNTPGSIGLENAGGGGTAGSHWDRVDLGDETMTGADINEPKYSIFTLALMEDTGWYKPNYGLADDIFWGKGDGCDFLTKKCTGTNFDEFCKPNNYGCDCNGDVEGYCSSDSLSNDCPYL